MTTPSQRPAAPSRKRSTRLARSYWALLGAVLLMPAVALIGKSKHSSAAARAKPALAVRAAVAEPKTACGEPPEPDCPLQGWMKANVSAALDAKDSVRLERALRRLAKLAPSGYDDWEPRTLEAAEAAKHNDFSAVRRACKSCHNAYRADYRRDHRSEPLH